MKPFDIAGAALAAQGPHEIHADIEFARDAGGMTYVRHQRAGYPFHLGRALRSPGDPAGMATLYLQSGLRGETTYSLLPHPRLLRPVSLHLQLVTL